MWHTLADVLARQPYYPIILVRCRHDAEALTQEKPSPNGASSATGSRGPDDRLETILQKPNAVIRGVKTEATKRGKTPDVTKLESVSK